MSSRESYSFSPSPPSDIGTYSRSMLQHTKRQMEAVNSSNSSMHSTSPGSSSNNPTSAGTSAMPNGVASRGRNPSDYSYQT
ncbi:hypothetical protein QBC47DRAFT_396972 [Echria macrotheca]|uniref:Uncharacterized protein n=1 Tax=Echria macrotheca TaxID=438768 RepID=A0AAJ0BN79_9PEZI|nr:hypothetical protein QBC47DRAFT_396972 [Echria macrotheca]